jgi:anti-sigma factor RsiW
MSVNETDLELLHTYLDGELPVTECEGLWRRLAVEKDLLAELEGLRADHAVRQAIWPTLEPADSQIARLETSILRSARRQDVLQVLKRGLTIVTTVAACLLFGFTVGWLGRDRYVNSPNATAGVPMAETTVPASMTTPASGKYIVNVRDGGHLVAVQEFNSYDEAQHFAQTQALRQASQQESDDSSNIIPAVAKF